MRRLTFLFLLLFTGFSAGTLRAQLDEIYLLDPSASSSSSSFGGNPFPGLGTNGLTGESCVQPGSHYYDVPDSAYGMDSQYRGISAKSVGLSEFDPYVGESSLTSRGEGGELYLMKVPAGKRSGIFQKLNFNALWVPSSGGNKGLGVTQLDLSAVFAVPFPTADSPLIVTPTFQTWFFDPNRDHYATKKTLYTTGADFRWVRPIVKNKLTLDLGVSVLYSGDFHAKGSKAMRYPAHLATIWHCNPRLKVILGVAYLDRNDDYNWLPMAGLIWTPNDDLSVELVLPRLRVAQRVRWFGSAAGKDKSDWLYTAFEFGGGSWGHKFDGTAGHLDYRDMRALIGFERRSVSGITIGFEVGYMFDRTYEFDRTGYKVSPSDSVFLRLRTSF